MATDPLAKPATVTPTAPNQTAQAPVQNADQNAHQYANQTPDQTANAEEPTPTEEPKPVEPVRKKCVPSAPSASRDRVKAALREIHDGLPPYSALRGTQGTQGAHKNGQIKNSEVDHA